MAVLTMPSGLLPVLLWSALHLAAADPSPPRPRPEPGPAALTTPEASRAAAPAWRPSRASARTPEWAPQSGDGEALFDDAPQDGPDGPLAQALLACRVDTFVNLDTTGQNDLKVTLRLGKLPELTVWGPEDQAWMYFTVPLVALSAGDALRFDVVDCDVTTDERVGLLEGKFDGRVPIHLESRTAAITCRALPRAQVDAEADGAMVVIDQALARGGPHLKLEPKQLDWGLHSSLSEVQRALVELAARVGWADPRTQRRLASLAEQEAHFVAAVQALFTREQAMLPAPGATVTLFGQLSVTVKGLACGPRALAAAHGYRADETREVLQRGRCVATVALENLTSAPLLLTDMPFRDDLAMPTFLAAHPLQGEAYVLNQLHDGKSEDLLETRVTLPPHRVQTFEIAPRYGGVFGHEAVAVEPELLQFVVGDKVARVRLK